MAIQNSKIINDTVAEELGWIFATTLGTPLPKKNKIINENVAE